MATAQARRLDAKCPADDPCPCLTP
jgi:hypothetical protein